MHPVGMVCGYGFLKQKLLSVSVFIPTSRVRAPPVYFETYFQKKGVRFFNGGFFRTSLRVRSITL